MEDKNRKNCEEKVDLIMVEEEISDEEMAKVQGGCVAFTCFAGVKNNSLETTEVAHPFGGLK